MELKDEAATSTNTGRSLRFPGHCLYTHTLTHQLHAERISGENSPISNLLLLHSRFKLQACVVAVVPLAMCTVDFCRLLLIVSP